MLKVSLITLGCNKNQVDSEFLAYRLGQKYQFTHELKDADIIILSPCAFLKSAREEALQYLQEVNKYKKNKCSCIVVIGCFAEYIETSDNKELDDADLIVGISNLTKLVDIIDKYYKDKQCQKYWIGNKNIISLFDPYKRLIPNEASSFVKISDGCSNNCSYCLIPKIRGPLRSRKMYEIIEEVKYLAGSGVEEINVLGQDIGSYEDGSHDLLTLLLAIEKVSGIKWIRLLYMHPKHINGKFVEYIAKSDKICNYIDLPIQHVNDGILEKMGRKTTKQEIIDILNLLRSKIPDIIIRSTFIVGFPGEGEKEFGELKDFIREFTLDRVGFFPFSSEEGTEAHLLEGQVPENIKQRRLRDIKKLQIKIVRKRNKLFIGKVLEVIVEELVDNEQGIYSGRSYIMAPEVDGDVIFSSNDVLELNKFTKVIIHKCDEINLYGKVVEKG
ncbi:30S ribosomal protein S12 methylthiotransferase RimO [bacterium]